MDASADTLRVAYIVARFPKVTETFILDEVLELERQGVEVVLSSFLEDRARPRHPDAGRLASRALFLANSPRTILRAHAAWLLRRPRTYLSVWRTGLSGSLRSPKALVRATAAVLAGGVVAQVADRHGCRHIHAHWATHPAMAALVAARLSRRPWSFTAHAHDLFVDRSALGLKAREAANVVTISDYNRRLILESTHVSADKVTVIRCGVGVAQLEPSDMPQRQNLFQLACVGALEEKKGQPFLLRAVDLLRKRGLPVHVTLVGGGPARAEIEQLVAQLDLTSSVTLTGPLARSGVIAAMRRAHVVVQPSVIAGNGAKEGIPVALMEAMALGRPVVASALSGIPELIRHEESGLLVPPGRPDLLAAAIQRLAADEALARRLAQTARAIIESDYALSKNVAALATIFADPTGEGSRSGAR